MTQPLNPEDAALPPADGAEDPFPKIRVSEVDTGAYARADSRGRTRLNKAALKLLKAAGVAHNAGRFFSWVAIHEGRQDGSLYLLPTGEDDPDKLRLSWPKAGLEVYFSLRKVLKAKRTGIPRGQALEMECFPATLPGHGAALELRFGQARLEPVTSRPKAGRKKQPGGDDPPPQA